MLIKNNLFHKVIVKLRDFNWQISSLQCRALILLCDKMMFFIAGPIVL